MPIKTHHADIENRIRHTLITYGPLSAKKICFELNISQPVFSRNIKKLFPNIVIFGKSRATLYAHKRTIAGVTNKLPVYEISEIGKVTLLATLHPVEPKCFFIESTISKIHFKYFENLPYFLDDLRPSGFLGRLVAKQYDFLHHPQDISLWSDSDCLRFLSQYGWDMIGNYIIGDDALQSYLNKKTNIELLIKERERESRYENMAKHVLDMGPAGSSAAGEQPKFLAIKEPETPVIVKFSPPIKHAVSKRLADLLVCEHIAHTVLNDIGITATESQILTNNAKRVFLELKRFDRCKNGRIGVVSLQTLNLEFVGSTKSWSDVSESLYERGLISQGIHNNICFLDLFGRLIANTDRHLGNISFITKNLEILKLAPVYDMLPMSYIPQYEQMRTTTMEQPIITPRDLPYMTRAIDTAIKFWQDVHDNPLITMSFKKIASNNSKILEMINY